MIIEGSTFSRYSVVDRVGIRSTRSTSTVALSTSAILALDRNGFVSALRALRSVVARDRWLRHRQRLCRAFGPWDALAGKLSVQRGKPAGAATVRPRAGLPGGKSVGNSAKSPDQRRRPQVVDPVWSMFNGTGTDTAVVPV